MRDVLHGTSRSRGGPRRPARATTRLTVILAVLLVVVGCGAGGAHARVARVRPSQAPKRSPSPSPTAVPTPELSQLPRGGRQIFPAFRVVAFYGAAGEPGLGVLGQSDPDTAAGQLEEQAQAYAPYGRPVLPCLELITTAASSSPGPAGTYSTMDAPSVVQQYLSVARAHHMLLLLDFQPGRSDFLSQIEQYQQFLQQPDVGVALDPEWRMGPGQIPEQVVGQTSATEINQVGAYLAAIVDRLSLPQKLFVVHQFNTAMVLNRPDVGTWPELALTFHLDGFGSPSLKEQKYHLLAPVGTWYDGIKLFYRYDSPMLTPQQVMALQPQPDMVSYQ